MEVQQQRTPRKGNKSLRYKDTIKYSNKQMTKAEKIYNALKNTKIQYSDATYDEVTAIAKEGGFRISHKQPSEEYSDSKYIYFCLNGFLFVEDPKYHQQDCYYTEISMSNIRELKRALGSEQTIDGALEGLREEKQKTVEMFGAKIDRFAEISATLVEQYEQKNTAYGDSFGKSVQKYGLISALTRMSDKWNRLENLILHPDTDNGDESLIDTLNDLASYCIMTRIEIEQFNN